jgi:hypothetical protein
MNLRGFPLGHVFVGWRYGQATGVVWAGQLRTKHPCVLTRDNEGSSGFQGSTAEGRLGSVDNKNSDFNFLLWTRRTFPGRRLKKAYFAIVVRASLRRDKKIKTFPSYSTFIEVSDEVFAKFSGYLSNGGYMRLTKSTNLKSIRIEIPTSVERSSFDCFALQDPVSSVERWFHSSGGVVPVNTPVSGISCTNGDNKFYVCEGVVPLHSKQKEAASAEPGFVVAPKTWGLLCKYAGDQSDSKTWYFSIGGYGKCCCK